MATISEKSKFTRQFIRFWRRIPVQFYRFGIGQFLGFLPLLILTTRKTSTGGPRHTPLEYRRHGSRIYVISPEPEIARWFAHVQEQPLVTIRIGKKGRVVRATVITDEAEAVRALFLFRLGVRAPLRWITWSARADSEIRPQALKQTARHFAVVRLEDSPEPLDELLLPPVTADRAWILWVMGGVLALMMMTRKRK